MVLSPSAGQGYLMCCVPKGSKTLYSHSTSLHPDVWELANLMLGANPVMDLHQIQGGLRILSVASCYRNQHKLQVLWATPVMTSILSRGRRNTPRCLMIYFIYCMKTRDTYVSTTLLGKQSLNLPFYFSII